MITKEDAKKCTEAMKKAAEENKKREELKWRQYMRHSQR